ncbi:unnamed protein product [Chrysoparadoxa australica]
MNFRSKASSALRSDSFQSNPSASSAEELQHLGLLGHIQDEGREGDISYHGERKGGEDGEAGDAERGGMPRLMSSLSLDSHLHGHGRGCRMCQRHAMLIKVGLITTAVFGVMALFLSVGSPLIAGAVTYFGHLSTGGSLVLFTLFFGVLIMIACPLWLVDLSAGYLFGIWAGLALTLFTKVWSSIVCFYLGRHALRRTIETRVFSKFDWLEALGDAFRVKPFRTALLIRFSALPAPVKSYGLGALPCPLGCFIGATIIVTGFESVLLVPVGSTLVVSEARHLTTIQPPSAHHCLSSLTPKSSKQSVDASSKPKWEAVLGLVISLVVGGMIFVVIRRAIARGQAEIHREVVEARSPGQRQGDVLDGSGNASAADGDGGAGQPLGLELSRAGGMRNAVSSVADQGGAYLAVADTSPKESPPPCATFSD